MEGEIVKWLVQEGDAVAEDQGLVEVMTDKATVTVPSPRKGRVLKRHGAEGDVAKVHAPLVTLEVDAAVAAAPVPTAQVSAAQVSAAKGPATAPSAKVLATPVTRRMAREHGLDLAEISGSGPQGRVTKADVVAAMEGGGGTRGGA